LLEVVGRKCDEFLKEKIKNIKVTDVEIDEIWSYCGIKQATKNRLGYDMSDEMTGDNYCMVGIEKNTKLVLAWHLGRRTFDHARMFMGKLDKVVANTFQTYQLSSDGYVGYAAAVRERLAGKVDYAQVVKFYGNGFPHQPFEPLRVIATKKYAKLGNPDLEKATTSHIERYNLDLRTKMKRLVRSTICYSKKWENLFYAYALNFVYYNFCWKHSTLKMTPAMASGLADKQWTVKDLLLNVA
jgi:IS1 family transposase